MENQKKHSNDENQDSVKETKEIYGTEDRLVLNDSDEFNPILMKLIEQSKAESLAGLGITHEEAMRRVKLRYPFLK